MNKQFLLLTLLALLFCPAHYAMEDQAAAQEKQESDRCSYCLEAFEQTQLVRNLPCKHHSLHQTCYKTWNNLSRANLTDIGCPVCRHPVKHFKIAYSHDEMNQHTSLLTNASEHIASIHNDDLRHLFTRISTAIHDQRLDEEFRRIVLNSFLGFLQADRIMPLIPKLIAERETLDDQVNSLLEQQADDAVRISALSAQNPRIALNIFNQKITEKNKTILELEQANKKLREAVYTVKKKKTALKHALQKAKDKNGIALHMLNSKDQPWVPSEYLPA